MNRPASRRSDMKLRWPGKTISGTRFSFTDCSSFDNTFVPTSWHRAAASTSPGPPITTNIRIVTPGLKPRRRMPCKEKTSKTARIARPLQMVRPGANASSMFSTPIPLLFGDNSCSFETPGFLLNFPCFLTLGIGWCHLSTLQNLVKIG